jgi:hypothetical protein
MSHQLKRANRLSPKIKQIGHTSSVLQRTIHKKHFTSKAPINGALEKCRLQENLRIQNSRFELIYGLVGGGLVRRALNCSGVELIL